MFKKFYKAGFTLIEIMVSLGIISAISLVIMSVQKQSVVANKDAKKNQTINELIQMLNSELSRVDVCKKNFENKPFGTTDVSISPLYNNKGSILLEKTATGQFYGDSLKINDILARKNDSKLTITVQYTPKNSTVTDSFTVGLNVFPIGSATIDSCFSDVNYALIQAVKYSCQGTGASYENETAAPPYGRCSHKIELQDSAGVAQTGIVSAGTTSFSCPNGEMLAEVLVNSDGNEAHDRRIFKCKKFKTNTTCTGWSYMTGIDANGDAICLPLLQQVTTNGILGTADGTVIIASVNTCPTGTLLTKISSFATPTCIDPNQSQNCPIPGQYVTSTNADGSVNCAPYPNNNTCSPGNYITAIDSAGVITCGAPSLSLSCGAGYVVTGVDPSGQVVCTFFGN